MEEEDKMLVNIKFAIQFKTEKDSNSFNEDVGIPSYPGICFYSDPFH